ncbi:hypothetical protein SLEP1_g55371 [Rubroshorea leprosula]|uniref:Bifunctional inhibitor/plant lipid transfer protein/seed storage helical domain-containing protein n=1 Tax=Rubroshorea leprosula TaxID=152421 RepID=A0AAV5MFB5_9ROSI|nr:hypothetical protein SLEP1_g55371 [Rubroshorea leprosula]
MKAFKVLQLISIIATVAVISVTGQISTPCTTSVITSFTPCLNFFTGSTANGGTTPTQSCCNSFKSLMSTSMDCACLIITANVPIPFNRTLSFNLPRACNMGGVPLQCEASGSPLPAPGPVPFLLPPPATSPLSPQGSRAATTAAPPASETPLDLSPAGAEAPKTSPGIRPVLTPNASNSSSVSPVTVFVILIGIIMFRLC